MIDSVASQPFFINRAENSSRPRLLLISYYFPPRQSAGALRWSKLTHYLFEAGWDLDVLMTPPAKWSVDGSLTELPPCVALHAVEDRPGRLRRFEDRVAALRKHVLSRANSSAGPSAPVSASPPSRAWIPASQLRWLPRSPRDLIRIYKSLVDIEDMLTWTEAAVRVGTSLAESHRYAGLLSSGPPWSTVVAASRLGSLHSLPVIHDFRDPWTLPQPGFMEKTAHPLGWVLEERIETAAIAAATLVIVNTPTVERAMTVRHPGLAFRTILNGVDAAFPRANKNGKGPFRIVYAGTIYLDRDPRVLFRAIRRVIERFEAGVEDLVIEFIGEASHYHATPIDALAEEEGIGGHLRLRGPLPRAELLEDLREASMLVSLPQSTPWSMPSKIYEYMGFDAWLLVFAHSDSATATVLRGSNAIVLDPDDLEGTTEAIARCYESHQRGVVPDGAADRERYARGHRGRELLAVLEEVGWTAR